jgi:hypothetical protein
MRPMAALAIASGYSTPSDGHNYSVRRAVDFGRVASAARCSANASALLLQLLSAASLLPAPAERGADSGTQRARDAAPRVRRAIRETAGKS